MKKSLVIFGIGICVGLGVAHFKKSAAKEPLTENSKEPEEHSVPSAQNEGIPAQQAIAQAQKESKPQTFSPAMDSLPEEPERTPPRPVSLSVTEESVDMMEQNIVELHQDVSLEKDRDGWIVHFHNDHNLMSSMGISNNDLILFRQFDEMKQDPATQDLASRIENVLSNLER